MVVGDGSGRRTRQMPGMIVEGPIGVYFCWRVAGVRGDPKLVGYGSDGGAGDDGVRLIAKAGNDEWRVISADREPAGRICGPATCSGVPSDC